jgi:hypothetical protein
MPCSARRNPPTHSGLRPRPTLSDIRMIPASDGGNKYDTTVIPSDDTRRLGLSDPQNARLERSRRDTMPQHYSEYRPLIISNIDIRQEWC